MASEIEAAAERLERWRQCRAEMRENCHEYAMDRMLQVQDEKTLIDWALSRLAADRAEREELARPIDAEWLESIGWHRVGRRSFEHQDYAGAMILREGGSADWCIDVYQLGEFKNRRQLLDLLRILKGGDE